MKLNPRERPTAEVEQMLRATLIGGVEVVAVHRLKLIINMHCPDWSNRCVACELPHPCRTYRVALGDRV